MGCRRLPTSRLYSRGSFRRHKERNRRHYGRHCLFCRGIVEPPVKCTGLNWGSSSNEDGPQQPGQPQEQCQSSPRVSSSVARPPPPDRSFTPRRRLCACRLASNRLLRLSQMTASRDSRQWTALSAYEWANSSPSTKRTSAPGSTLGASNSPLCRAGMTHSWRTFARNANRHLTTLFRSHIVIRHLRYALIRKARGRLTSCSCHRETRIPFVCKKGQVLSLISGGKLPRDHPAPKRGSPQQGHH